MRPENSNDKYSTDNNQFFYDENNSKNGIFLKQDSELFNDEDYIPGKSIRIKRIKNNSSEDWQVLIDDVKQLLIKGNRFTAKERKFLRTSAGMLFMIDGIKNGWLSVSDFKRNIKV